MSTLIEPPGPLTVVVDVVVVAVVVVVITLDATANLPCMPSFAWPVTVHRYAYWPFFLKLTVIVCVLPGASSLVLILLILKSWPVLPLVTNLNFTLPFFGTVPFESLNLKSVMVTVMVGIVAFFAVGPEALPVPAATPA